MFRRREKRPFAEAVKETFWPTMGWRRAGRYWMHRVGRVPGTPYGISAGFASGVAMAMTPFMGVHFPLSIGLAWLLRGSIAASLLGTLFGNPVTWPFIWLATYRLGCFVLHTHPHGNGPMELSWNVLRHSAWQVVAPMTVGGFLSAALTWPLVFMVLRPLIARYKHHRIAASHHHPVLEHQPRSAGD